MVHSIHLRLLVVESLLCLSVSWLLPRPTPLQASIRKIMPISTSKSSGDTIDESYHSGISLLSDSASSLLSKIPRLAKNEDYANAILGAWKADVDSRPTDCMTSIAAPIIYRGEQKNPLYGYVYRPSIERKNPSRSKPGVILFHTGAGPQDVFLRWKADSLSTDTNTFPDGAVVLIADILGDETGWAWDTDRSRYENVASTLLVPDENGERIMLQSRVHAALDTLRQQPDVDQNRIGVVGFCLGGHPILELGRMKDASVKAMVSFHGVFGSVHKMKVNNADDAERETQCEVLICTGEEDPFVPTEDVTTAQQMFERLGHNVTVLSYEGTKHGFTNPAQACNTNPAFDYNDKSCNLAWNAMLTLLNEALG